MGFAYPSLWSLELRAELLGEVLPGPACRKECRAGNYVVCLGSGSLERRSRKGGRQAGWTSRKNGVQGLPCHSENMSVTARVWSVRWEGRATRATEGCGYCAREVPTYAGSVCK